MCPPCCTMVRFGTVADDGRGVIARKMADLVARSSSDTCVLFSDLIDGNA